MDNFSDVFNAGGKLLNSLSLHDYIKHIFYEERILTLYDILLALRRYDFMSPQELEDYIAKDYVLLQEASTEVGTGFQYLNMRKQSGVKVNREPRLSGFEKEHRIVIDKVNRSLTNVYIPLGVQVDTLDVENVISAPECKFYKVAPDWVAEQNGERFRREPKLLYKAIIFDAIKEKASDVHLTAVSGDKKMEYPVYYRVNEDYIRSTKYPTLASSREQADIVAHMLQGTAVDPANLSDSCGASVSIPNLFGPDTVILRVNITTNYEGYDFSARIQTQDSLSLEIRSLGFDKAAVRSLEKTAQKKSGMTIFTGKFKSGKTMSMMALAKEIHGNNVKQYGVFSPMEFKTPFGVKEYDDKLDVLLEEVSQIKKKDIDVVHLNEIPNTAVGMAAWDLINSNVHVVTTTHLDRIWHLPHKLYEIYSDRFRDLMTQMNVVYNQKMFIYQCPHCREVQSYSTDIPDLYREFMDRYKIRQYYKASGCELCIDGKVRGGYHPLVEFIEFDFELVNQILECSSNAQIERLIYKKMHASQTSLEYKVAEEIMNGNLGLEAIKHFI